jgi:xanthine dehydrogenase accessory factor
MKLIADLLASGRGPFAADAVVMRVARFQGFGGRRAGDAVVVEEGVLHGSLLMGAADDALLEAAAALGAEVPWVLVDVPVGDREAVEAGLACGGSATLLAQRVASIDPLGWAAMAQRDAVVLVTPLEGELAGETAAVTATRSSGRIAAADRSLADRVLSRGGAAAELVEREGRRVLVEAVFPDPSIVVLGASALADAIVAQAAVMGAVATVFDERAGAHEQTAAVEAAAGAGPVDAVVVLSHDLAASTAVLDAALRGGCGYVGALGSRHTQAARAERLRSVHGHDEASLARVHGPVGLDLGARTPAETAVAIAAEWLAVRSGRSAANLRASCGPING